VVSVSLTSEKRLVFSLAPLHFPFVDEAHIWFFVVTQCGRQKKSEKVPEAVRLRTNDKERQRMHQLNTAMDNLRRAIDCIYLIIGN
jgi:mevalonate kinase